MYGYMFKLPFFICNLGDLNCIFGMNARKIGDFHTCSWRGKNWFHAKLSRCSCNAIFYLRAVKRIELKLLKDVTNEVVYVKQAMSKHCKTSWVHCTTHSSLLAVLGMIMMDSIADLSSASY